MLNPKNTKDRNTFFTLNVIGSWTLISSNGSTASRGGSTTCTLAHVNPVFVKMLRTIGFDKGYVRGEGSYLYDEDGNRYLDFLTGWGVFALGRNHPRVRSMIEQVMSRQMPNLVRMECSLLAGLVAEKLTSHAGAELSRVFFTNSGTESVETAIKFARCTTGKRKILYCENAFHGLTVGSLSLNGAEFFRERFGDLMPGTEAVAFNDLASLERALSRKDVAAFVDRGCTGQDVPGGRGWLSGRGAKAVPESRRAAGDG